MAEATLDRAPANGATHPEVPEGEDGSASNDAFVMDAGGQLSFAVSGKKPTGSSLRIVGGRTDVSGQFEKGQTIRVELVLRCDEVAFVDEVDRETQQVVACERRHKFRLVQAPRIVG